MRESFLAKSLRLNIHGAGTGTALIVLALTQIPVAIKTTAELACIGELSHKIWEETKSHRNTNSLAVQSCNGSSKAFKN